MNSERKAFIKAFGGMYHDPCEWDEERNCFKESHVHIAWNAWQLSIQRQGYKLVPVEPTEEMYLTGYDCKVQNGSTIDIYKAMIGAVNDH